MHIIVLYKFQSTIMHLYEKKDVKKGKIKIRDHDINNGSVNSNCIFIRNFNVHTKSSKIFHICYFLSFH